MAGRRVPQTEPLEIEVKLSVSRPRLVGQLIRHPWPDRLAGFRDAGDVRLRHITDRYLDTDVDRGRVAAAGMRARLRREGDVVTITVKRAGIEHEGVTTRVELEGAATRSLDPARWPASQAKSTLLLAIGGRRLREVGRLRQRRLKRLLSRDATTVEVSLDAIQAVDDGVVLARRWELEAELISGESRDLADLGAALLRIGGIGPPLGSKLLFAVDARRNAHSGRARSVIGAKTGRC